MGEPLPISHFSALGASCKSAAEAQRICVAVCVALDAGGQELVDNVQQASLALVARGGCPLEECKNLFFLC